MLSKLRRATRGAFFLLCLLKSVMAHSQAVPADFLLTVTAGGVAPWSEATTIALDGHGQLTLTRATVGGIAPPIADTTYAVSLVTVQQFWQAIQDSSFFGLQAPVPDSTFDDGSFAEVGVTANGVSHQVIVKNAPLLQFQSLIDSLNAIATPSFQLFYLPPVPPGTPPRIQGERPSGYGRLVPSTGVKSKDLADAGPAIRVPASLSGSPAVLPHPGTVVAYDEPLSVAVADRTATLRSKGNYFGDDVSITVDNTSPRSPGAITITLYLEFRGPLATQVNVDKINADIKNKWTGHTTTGGKPVGVEIVTRIAPDASASPATPGFHQIQIVANGAVRSNVTGPGGVNSGTREGRWELDLSPGTYGHEAGHLMGLVDLYDDFHKQHDGSWLDAKTGTSYPNNDQMATYAASKFPGSLQSTWRTSLQTRNVCSIPKDMKEDDLMADVAMPVLPTSIDSITSNPGLLVRIPEGSVLSNRNGSGQSLVVTHAEDLFLTRGERRTLKGIYGACIDHGKGIPDSTGLFDLIPPLGSWRGIAAAGYLLQFVHFVDSAGFYTGEDFTPQEAIWRITDNGRDPLAANAEFILNLAGIHLGDQVLDFPRLTPTVTLDTTTIAFVPDELIVADIQPRFLDGSPGVLAAFTLGVTQPVNAGFATGVSWSAKGPDTAAVAITGNGTGASLTPSRTGMYEIGIAVTSTDSVLNKRTFASPVKAYVVVPDSMTETFEHANLAARFPWRTYGDVPWSISGTHAQTGALAAHPGPLGPGQTSVLAIDLALPSDGAITFSIRTACMEIVDNCLFGIDSVQVDQFTGIADWRPVRYPLRAGVHTLTWTSTGAGTTADRVWLDNVFFPPHSVVTSLPRGRESLPAAYLLAQNYPNPFNPATTIRYGIPARSHVSLVVYNTLGELVARLIDGEVEAGYHELKFDGASLASGVYFYRIQAGDFVSVKKLLLLR